MKENKSYSQEEIILKFLSGDLSEEEKATLELELASDNFAKEALEGLTEINQNTLPTTLHQINTDLKKQLRKRHKKSMKIITPSWIYITFTILIIVAIAAYFIIKMLK